MWKCIFKINAGETLYLINNWEKPPRMSAFVIELIMHCPWNKDSFGCMEYGSKDFSHCPWNKDSFGCMEYGSRDFSRKKALFLPQWNKLPIANNESQLTWENAFDISS